MAITKLDSLHGKYGKIIAAIPHSVPDAKQWNWTVYPRAVAWRDQWTDWFTDKLL